MTSLFMVRHFYKVDMNIGTLLVIFRYSMIVYPMESVSELLPLAFMCGESD